MPPHSCSKNHIITHGGGGCDSVPPYSSSKGPTPSQMEEYEAMTQPHHVPLAMIASLQMEIYKAWLQRNTSQDEL